MELLRSYFGTGISFFTGILLILSALPLVLRKIGRNSFYGFRLSYSLKDDDIWYEVNAMLGKHLIYQGVILLILGGVSCLFENTKKLQLVAVIVLLIVLVGGIIFSLIAGTKKMNQMAVEKGLKKK